MAHIRANTKNGKIVSYRFTVCLGRDCNGKQIRKYTTWPIPPDTSTAKAKKAAERAADIWEQELMNEYHKKLEAESAGKAYQIPAEKRHDDFVSFVNDVWFPLQVRDGKHKPKTIAFYESMTKLLLPCFSGSTLQGIGSLDIQRCLREKLGAVVMLAEPKSAAQIKNLAESLDLFDFAPDAHSPAEYGKYMIQQSGHFDYDENLDAFYDYEKYGTERMNAEDGMFTDRGYIAYKGYISMEEVMNGSQSSHMEMGGLSR